MAIGRRLTAADLPDTGVTGDGVVLNWRLVERIVGAAKEKFATG